MAGSPSGGRSASPCGCLFADLRCFLPIRTLPVVTTSEFTKRAVKHMLQLPGVVWVGSVSK
jgi:hypothetical protein